MSGISKNDGQRLTVAAPHLYNASFIRAEARMTAGQIRHISWTYVDEDTGAKWSISPLTLCKDRNGVAATQHGTWGTLAEHWLPIIDGTSLTTAVADVTNATAKNNLLSLTSFGNVDELSGTLTVLLGEGIGNSDQYEIIQVPL